MNDPFDTPALRALAELNKRQELMDRLLGPESRALKQLQEADAQREMLRRMADPEGSLLRAAGLVNWSAQEAESRRITMASFAQFADVTKGPIAKFAEDIQRYTEAMALVSERLLGHFKVAEEALRQVAWAFPDQATLANLAKLVSETSLFPQSLDRELLRQSLYDKAASITQPWTIAGAERISFTAFAELTFVAEAATSATPFAERESETIEQALGSPIEVLPSEETPELREQRHSAAGRNPAVVAFPRPAFGSVLLSVGILVEIPPTPVPEAEENSDPHALYDASHQGALTRLEQHLRIFVETQMRVHAGERWDLQRVPQQVRSRWIERRDAARERGRPVYRLIQYADFMDLADIIRRGDNWREVFGVFFGSTETFSVAMTRLHGIRLELAHARPLTMSDVLDLAAETARLLTAMQIPAIRLRPN